MRGIVSVRSIRQQLDRLLAYDAGPIQLAPDELPSLSRERRLEGLGT